MRKRIQVVTSAVLVLAGAVVKADSNAAEPALAFSITDRSLQWSPCPSFIPEGCEIAILHGDPAQPGVDVFFKVPADFAVPKHWHTSAERMVLVSGRLTVKYDGQPARALEPGEYAYGPAKLAHEATCAAGAPCILFIAFDSPLDAVPAETPKQ